MTLNDILLILKDIANSEECRVWRGNFTSETIASLGRFVEVDIDRFDDGAEIYLTLSNDGEQLLKMWNFYERYGVVSHG